jgi:hypothetical protein
VTIDTPIIRLPPSGKPASVDDAHERPRHAGVHSDPFSLSSERDLTGELLGVAGVTHRRVSHWRMFVALLASGGAVIAAVLILHAVHGQPVNATPAYLVTKTFKVDPAKLPLDLPAASAGQPVPPDGPGSCTPTLAPNSLIVPSVCIDGSIVGTTRQATGALLIPGDVHDVGLWNDGEPLLAPTGAVYPAGTTLLAGHVNYVGQGDGALFNLYRVQPGALVYATDASGRATLWRVVSAVSLLKADLPASVFAGTQGARRLVIVTCGGSLSYIPGTGWTYDDNVVVTAVPLGSS